MYSELATGVPDFAFLLLAIVLITPAAGAAGYLAGHLADKHDLAAERGSARSRSVRRVLFWCVWVLLSLMLMGVALDGYIRLNTYSTFQQYLSIVTPYIGDRERQQLLSQFASMRCRADYVGVMSHLQRIADSNSIALPPNKLYPILGQ